ncbi:kinesin-like protein KIF27 [Polymixia lowei]
MNEVCVRVAVRIRPLLSREVLHNHRVCVRVVPGSTQVVVSTDRVFSFNHAFGPTASQDEVYESCVQPLVESVVEGHNATVFAYGQTGSGKTYTLGGGHEECGIVSRVAQDVFLLLGKKRQMSGCGEAEVRVSYMELYMEELRDLLELHTNHKELHIREDDRGNTVVVGAKETVVASAEELLTILEAGNALRHTGTTGMNERSSRSHAILTLQLTQRCHDNSSSSCLVSSSKLHLVDLAGLEHAGKTGNTGTRLKESVHINTGLLALGNVIRALSDPRRNRRGHSGNNTHVPYRDAKITRLLRDSLGGTAHTLMVACVSPSHHSVAETLSALQFACRVRHVRNHPGTTSSRTEMKFCPTAWDPSEARLEELEYEVQTLKEVLKEKEQEMEREREKAGGKARREEDSSSQANHSDRISDSATMVNQEEAPQYRLLAQEAAVLLEDISSPALSPALKYRLEDWLGRLLAVNQIDDEDSPEVNGDQPHHVTILQLRRELNKCQEALAIDDQILEEKEEELRQLQKEVQKLLQERKTHLQALEEEGERTRIQTRQLVDQQILIDHLHSDLVASRTATPGASSEAEPPGYSDRKSHSAPPIRHSCGHEPARKIHTSPPAYSLERVMAAFKMRGQLLLAEIEEKEEVYCPFIRQRSLNRTWTGRQKKTALKQNSAGLDQNSNKETQLAQQPQLATGSQERVGEQLCLKKAGLRASFTQRRIQELSINMRMKEELIKKLDRTGKEAQAADKHGRHSDDGREAGVLTRLSLQSQENRAQLYHSLQHMRQQRAQLQTSLRQDRETSHATKELDPHRGLRAEDLTVYQNNLYEESKEKKHDSDWLETEEERALQRRAELQELEEELRRREEVLQRRETILQQRNKLEVKRLRSSQAVSQDLLRVSVRLETLEEQLADNSEAGQTRGVPTEELEKERDALRQRRDALDAQLKDGSILTAQEEHCLFQLEEAIEALDAALEFKNRSIQDRQKQLSITASSCQSHSTEPTHHGDVTRKLKELSTADASELLVKYFNKVVRLREEERRLQLHCEELQLQVEEQEGVMREMEAALQCLALDTDRRLTRQHQEYQTTIQLLLQQLKEGGPGKPDLAIQARIQQLEKDLFFYKSSSRQLKKKVNELLCDSPNPQQRPATQPSHTRAHDLQVHARGNNHHAHSEATQTKTHGERTRTKTDDRQEKLSQAQARAEQALVEKHQHQTSHPSSFSNTQTHRNTMMPAHGQMSEHSQSPGSYGQEDGSGVGGLEMVPIRLSRRELRQICPADRRVSGSAIGGRYSVVKSSTESILEDSIEMSRNTE